MSKAVSDIIAMLLMLIITIGLASLAYAYITGKFTSMTAVTLSITGETKCAVNNGVITVGVRNDGQQATGAFTPTITPPSGAVPTCTAINSIAPGTQTTTTCTGRNGGVGTYAISASTGGSTASGSIYCSS